MSPEPFASSNSVVAATPLTPPELQTAEMGASPSLQSVLVLQVEPVRLQTPVFFVQLESFVQLAPALTALASQVPGLVVQVPGLATQDVPAFPEVALQVPAIVQLLFAVQDLVGWLLQ